MYPKTIFSLNGAMLIEYEAGKFKIIKEKSILNLPDYAEGIENKYTNIGQIAISLYNKLDVKHKFGSKYNHGYDPTKSVNLNNILIEIISNVELHGNKYDPNKVTWIQYTFNEDETQERAVFTMTIRDEGEGFDHNHLRNAELAARGTEKTYNNFRQVVGGEEDGLGIFETLRYCDKVTWNNKGNEITITKILQKPK